MKKHIEHLRGDTGGGLNGTTLLRSETNPRNTFDDAAVDQLFNDKNHDWIFVNSDVGTLDLFDDAKYQDELDTIASASFSIFGLNSPRTSNDRQAAPLNSAGDSLNLGINNIAEVDQIPSRKRLRR